MQLALAVALHRHMLPGLTSKPLAFDPDFDQGDVALLNSLGFDVAAAEPSHAVRGPTLLYMPCCPRQLYSDVLVRHNSQWCPGGRGMRGCSCWEQSWVVAA